MPSTDPSARWLDSDAVALVLAVIGALGVVASGVSPTGSSGTDAAVTMIAVVAAVWLAARASTWLVTALAGLSAAVALDPVAAAIGAAGFALGVVALSKWWDLRVVNAAIAALALNSFARSALDGFFGLSAIIAITAGAVIIVAGLARSERRTRWLGGVALAGVVVVGVAATALLGAVVAGARTDLDTGEQQLRRAVEMFESGDYAAASATFSDASATFDRIAGDFDQPWVQPARFVPVAAQHRQLGAALSSSAAAVAAELSAASVEVDPDRLRLAGGQIDLDALRDLEPTISDSFAAIVDLRAVIADTASPWYVEPLQRELDEVAEELDADIESLDQAVEAVRLAPPLLGGDGPRRYFVGFTTPAEARGVGGFMGNYALLTVDDGRISLTGFGRTGELNRFGGERFVSGPEEWLDQYGRFGFDNGPGGATGDVPWSNVTMSPHFPSTAQVVAELFPQSGGVEVDGVFMMDPYVLQAFIGFTGPIRPEGVDQRLNRRNTAEFLLFDQYAIEDASAREDVLANAAEATFRALLDGSLPGPAELVDRLGPLVEEGRLVGWVREPDEQALFADVGLDGALPPFDGADGFEVVVNNAGANKVDAYLERSIAYDAVVDPVTSTVDGTVTIRLTNNAPTTGLPDGVIGNYTGDPTGTNRMHLSLFSAVPIVGATVDGEPVGVDLLPEAGWLSSSRFVTVPPGSTVELVYDVQGRVDAVADDYELVVRTQPLVASAVYDIDVRTADGDVLAAAEGPLEGTSRIPAEAP